MARTTGSVNLVRVEFEREFWRYCENHEYSPGFACAKLMHKAAQAGNVRDFVSLGVMADRLIAPAQDDGPQESLTLVLDRTRDDTELDNVRQIARD